MKSKIKIMNAKPDITDEEIRSFMNFEKLLETQKAFHRLKLIRNGGLSVIGMAMLASLWFYLKPTSSEYQGGATESNEKIIVPKSGAETTDSAFQEKPTIQEQNREPQKPITQRSKDPKDNLKTDQSAAEVKEDSSSKLSAIYLQAEPEDGYPALYQYFSKELTYPLDAVRDSIQGVVVVAFTINKEGRPEKISVEQSLGDLFDKEAIRVIANMPKWKPATYNGKAMSSKMSVPLTFQINKIEK